MKKMYCSKSDYLAVSDFLGDNQPIVVTINKFTPEEYLIDNDCKKRIFRKVDVHAMSDLFDSTNRRDWFFYFTRNNSCLHGLYDATVPMTKNQKKIAIRRVLRLYINAN